MSPHRLVLAVSSLRAVPRKARWLLLRVAGVKTDAWNIGHGCLFTGNRVTIGRSTFVNSGCVFDSSASISIGERCAIGPDVMFVSGSHELGTSDRRAGAIFQVPG